MCNRININAFFNDSLPNLDQPITSNAGDVIISGNCIESEFKYTTVPQGLEIWLLSNTNMSVTDALIDKLKKQEDIKHLGYKRDDHFYPYLPIIYQSGETIPDLVLKAFPKGIINQVGCAHIEGVYKDLPLSQLWFHLRSYKKKSQNIRCFWTANFMTDSIHYPELIVN
ncbi:hypothetical protein [Flammeovirga agarivorans]|uniref:Uncharacterized protein n=1 Tax=Flammeovirga agarivorans TaxID=2726742 RepID=A0A7X8SKW3_9BACT|nr:hypothetical protein [Flammeovirga agarivorans]NLR92099.1 hypothetical protein [Flammeovirga agarivorans]